MRTSLGWTIALPLACVRAVPPPVAPTPTGRPAVLRAEVATPPLVAGEAVSWLGSDAAGRAQVQHAGAAVEVPAAAVALLPTFVTLRAAVEDRPAGSAEMLVGVEGDWLLLDLAGPFAPEPQPARVARASVDLGAPASAALLGDLPGDAWVATADGDEACARLARDAVVAGLGLPAGATLRCGVSSALVGATLAQAAELGGVAAPAGTRLDFGQGCDVALLVPGEELARCLLLQDGRLVEP